MNNSILRAGICALVFTMARGAMADSDTVFPAHEFSIYVYGETGNGSVDTSGGGQKEEYGTKTVTSEVLSPAVPTPPSGVITVAEKPGFKAGAVGIRPLQTPPTTTTTTVGDVTTTTTKTEKRTEHLVPSGHTEDSTGGGGIEAAWFFSRYVGVAIEGDFLGGETFVSQLTGQLILRYPFDFGRKPIGAPIGEYSKDPKDVRSGKDVTDNKGSELGPPTWGLAPYFICGGGSQWDGECVGIADVGGGVEVRCAAGWGVFADGRWVVHDSHENYGSARLGVSYSF